MNCSKDRETFRNWRIFSSMPALCRPTAFEQRVVIPVASQQLLDLRKRELQAPQIGQDVRRFNLARVVVAVAAARV